MSPDHPNVLMLTADALRADRLGLHGYNRPTSPALDGLVKDSIVCDQAYAIGAFTSISFPTIFTSSRPLSHGGFDHGVFRRPATMFAAFHRAGYRTSALSTVHWIHGHFGYGSGVDHEEMLFGLNTLAGLAVTLSMGALDGFRRGEYTEDELLRIVEPALEQVFDSLIAYCQERLANVASHRNSFPNSLFSRADMDFAKVRAVVERHRAQFRRDKLAYITAKLDDPDGAGIAMVRDWRYLRTWRGLAVQGLFQLTNRMLGAIDRRRALLRYNRYKRYIDAADLADHVIRTLERQDRDRPFFLWSHFFDTHVPYCPGSGAAWYRQADNYLAKLGYPRGLDVTVGLKKRPATEDEWSTWAALYDGAVRYVDDQIGRIVDALDRLGLRDNTLIVVCGDHGEELGEHGDMSHHFRLYEHNVRVPMLFSMPGIEARRVRGFSTLLDLAPTTAALCGVAPDKAWAGRSLVDGDGTGPSVVVMETFHGSPCLYDKRPLYFAVRSDRYKYLWREYRDRTDRFSPDGPELFDLSSDPFERTNIYRPDHPAVIAGNHAIARRMAEIPEITRERIERAFGPRVLADAAP